MLTQGEILNLDRQTRLDCLGVAEGRDHIDEEKAFLANGMERIYQADK